ncbi:hypothetical protein TNCT_419541 [Trichonephila clavata]|uniref:Uncharacterized protein n=1 Tax=Trichonephila clavata TaxID=2740835 RepID=A0A8X6IEB3_TRICU|nr:hypothetical protein TNCT_419541 [Trichonephila clavata]
MKIVPILGLGGGGMHRLQADGALVRNLKHEIWKRGTLQELESRVTQRHPLIQILGSTIIPGPGGLSIQVGFHKFCPYAWNVGLIAPFHHPLEHVVSRLVRLVEAETGKRYLFYTLPRWTKYVPQSYKVLKMLLERFYR